MKGTAFYLGLALILTHELDAMSHHEWRVLPLLSQLEDAAGQNLFVILHIPILAIVVACIASLNIKLRRKSRDIASGFLIVHAVLHFAFSSHANYEFNSLLSSILIYGAALCGMVYFLSHRRQDFRQPEN